MNKKWLVILLLLIVATISYLALWIWNNPSAKAKFFKIVAPSLITSGGIPLELAEEFDPTINSSTFMFEEKLDGGKIKINRVFPPLVNNQIFESEIDCEEGIMAKAQGDKKSKRIDLKELSSLLVLENSPILITSKCNSPNCKVLVGECNIFLSGKSEL